MSDKMNGDAKFDAMLDRLAAKIPAELPRDTSDIRRDASDTVKRTPSEKLERKRWLQEARRLFLADFIAAEIQLCPRRTVIAKLRAIAASYSNLRPEAEELIEFIGPRASNADRCRRYRERKAPRLAAKRPKNCAYCGQELTGLRAGAKTCSAACRTSAYRLRHPGRK